MQILEIEKENSLSIKIRNPAYFVGDCVLETKHQPVVGKKVAGNWAFNTAFFTGGVKNV